MITKLGGGDEHYGRVQLPLTIALQDVQSVERLEVRHMKTVMLVVGIVVVAAAIVFVTAPVTGLD